MLYRKKKPHSKVQNTFKAKKRKSTVRRWFHIFFIVKMIHRLFFLISLYFKILLFVVSKSPAGLGQLFTDRLSRMH